MKSWHKFKPILSNTNNSQKFYRTPIKVSLQHINVTQSVGEHRGESIKDNITEVPKAQRATEP